MLRLWCTLLVGILLSARVVAAAESVFDIRDFGAKVDGQSLCTDAIQNAIDKCSESGGGTVLLPPGRFLSGTIVLKSHVTLKLDAGCVVLGSTDIKHYPPHIPALRSYTDNYVKQSLIYGEDLEDVAIVGSGVIDGQGAAFKATRERPYENRPYIIRMINCRDVLVEGVQLRNSPMWMQHYLACQRLVVRGLRVYNQCNANNDGIDIDACKDVTVSQCIIDSEDDGICLKSTLDRPCENVSISNCVARSRCNGIKLGTESNGGFVNIAISNCAVASPSTSTKPHDNNRGLAGIALELVDGGRLDGVSISNIVIKGVRVPIFLRLGHRARPFMADGPTPAVGTFRNVIVSGIVATDASTIGCSITGLPGHSIQGVTLSHCRFTFQGGGKAEMASKVVEELPSRYPECTMFGELPAFGFYCRHVRDLRFDQVVIHAETPDGRRAVVCEDVEDGNF